MATRIIEDRISMLAKITIAQESDRLQAAFKNCFGEGDQYHLTINGQPLQVIMDSMITLYHDLNKAIVEDDIRQRVLSDLDIAIEDNGTFPLEEKK